MHSIGVNAAPTPEISIMSLIARNPALQPLALIVLESDTICPVANSANRSRALPFLSILSPVWELLTFATLRDSLHRYTT